MIGICNARKPWLTVFEFMEYKDLGTFLRACKTSSNKLRLNEMLLFPTQVVEACKFLVEVRLASLTAGGTDATRRNALCTATSQCATF